MAGLSNVVICQLEQDFGMEEKNWMATRTCFILLVTVVVIATVAAGQSAKPAPAPTKPQ